ncbi:MAG TPA: RHS repeat-associated core domain-containing protein [Anaerolineales bacterium]|nr:RHS repeat-associated core domain-containing protein [Anaerolineales bacterium]
MISIVVGGQTTSFMYDGDGNLVKKIKPDGSKTLYVGGLYEVNKNSGGTVTGTVTYYPAAGAMRVGSTLYYVLKDELGSASVVTDSTGATVGEDRFFPFGETRFTTGTMNTDKLFTGQREITGLGIYDYGARFYSPKLGRFLSADTIVPGYTNPQNLNRFSYTVNNPIRYTDPTGHWNDPGCGSPICNDTQSGGSSTGTTGGRAGSHSGSNTSNDPPAVVVPPIVLIPPLDTGPIIISPSSPLEEEPDLVCQPFKNQYRRLLATATGIYNEINALKKELENPKLDPITRKAIQQKLINLRSQLTDLRQELEVLKDLADAAGCSLA